ncbi:WD40 repeat domain-containing protein [Streptomyces phaeofaciens]|uniref:WD40 repeat domain-containing protein n=1 Tax=Streptomyces phaeofaciens TaxID=68254 RepID=UPI0036ABFE70
MQSIKTEIGIEITGFGATVLPLLYPSSTGRTDLVTCALGRLHRWDADTGELLCEFQVTEAGSGDMPNLAVVVLPDGQVRIGAPDDDGLWLWDGVDGRLLVEPQGGANHLFEVAGGVLGDGKGLFLGGGASGLYRWDAVTGQPTGPVPEEPLGYVVGLTTAVLRDGTSLIVASSEDGEIHRWHAVSGEPFGELITAPHVVALETVYLPDSRAVFVGAADDGEVVRQWDAQTGVEMGPAVPTPDMVGSMATATVADQMRLFTVGEEDVVRQWDLLTGDPVGQTFTGCSVSATALSDGSALLAVGTRDGIVTTHRLN